MATILIVDDRPDNRNFLGTLLECGGHRLLHAADGAEALSVAQRERPDLLITDLLMPTMDGYELLRRLRGDSRIAQTPVIFWTAHYREREAKALARDWGVSAVIIKPAEPEQVLSAVESALGVTSIAVGIKQPTEEFDRAHLRLLTDKLLRTVDDLRITNERLSALIDLNLQLALELDLKRLIQNFGHAARQIIGARFCIIGILDADGKQFQQLFTSGMDAETAARLGSQDPSCPPLKALLQEGASTRLRNPAGDPVALGFAPSHPPIYSWLGAPVTSPTRRYGYIGLIDKIGCDEFSAEDESLTAILAAQVGRIYQNGSLYSDVLRHASELEREIAARTQTEKALAERVRQAALIGEIDAALTQSNAQDEMLNRCAEALVQFFDARLTRIWTINGASDVLELKASAGVDVSLDGTQSRVTIGDSAIGCIAQQRSPYVTKDLFEDPFVCETEWAVRENVASFAGYPLIFEHRLAGVVGVFASRQFSATELDVIGTVAPKIALGIERYRSSEALRERDEHIRLLLDSTAEAIYGIDLEGRCTFANSTCGRFLGRPNTEEFLGRDMHELMHHTRPDGSKYLRNECRIYQAFQKNQHIHVDHELFWRADGSSFPAEYWSYPIHREGVLVGSVVTFLDISERRRLESRFHQAQQRLHDVVVSSPAVLFTLSISEGEFAVDWISDNLLALTGHDPQHAVGTEWWQANIHPEDREKATEQARDALLSLGQSVQEYRFRHIDGTYRWMRSDMRLIRDDQGSPFEVVGAWFEITELKQAEQERLKLREQLEQVRKLESVGQLAGGVAHDFNNLLGVVIGSAEILQSDLPENSELRGYTADILDAAHRGAELTRQLLAFSRQQVFQPAVLCLSTLVGEFEKLLRRIIPTNIEIRTALKSGAHVRADAGQIEQVIMNLVVNARDAMPAGGRLTIETFDVQVDEARASQLAELKPGSYVVLAVIDSGHGMTSELMSRIFEPFYTTKERGKGTGLGLGTVHGIVKQSGGSIYVYSEPGRGSAFKVYLPRLEGAIDPATSRFSEGEMPRGNETILIVEDESRLRTIMAEILRGLSYSVLMAENGEDALRIAGAYNAPIHLLVTDIVMPGVGGRELADSLLRSRPDLHVLYISGYTDDSVIAQGVLSNQMVFLQKPISSADLAQSVRSILDERQTCSNRE